MHDERKVGLCSLWGAIVTKVSLEDYNDKESIATNHMKKADFRRLLR
jgi:hypothetical protein